MGNAGVAVIRRDDPVIAQLFSEVALLAEHIGSLEARLKALEDR